MNPIKCIKSGGKVVFLNKKNLVYNINKRRQWGVIAPYLCSHCGYWHRTSDPVWVRGFVSRHTKDGERVMTDPFASPGSKDKDGPGDWFTAGFDSPCAYGDQITEGDTIRATGDGEWEHRDCVERDEELPTPLDGTGWASW